VKFLPYDSFDIETNLTADELRDKLQANIDPAKLFSLPSVAKPFRGTLTQQGFRIWRIIAYGNSFLPIIEGRFSQAASGVRVSVRMRMHWFITGSCVVWFGGAGFAFAIAILALLEYPENAVWLCLGTTALFLFGWILMSACFWWEAKKARSILVDILLRDSSRP